MTATQPEGLNMKIEMECPTCGTLCEHSGEDDWTPVELLSASKPAASMSVAQRDSIWVAAEAMEKIDQHVHASELRAMLATSPAAPAQSAEPVAWRVKKSWEPAIAWRVTDRLPDTVERDDYEIVPLYAALQPAQSAEPVYQVQTGDSWLDMTREQYERHSKSRPTRILYTAPQPSPTAVVLDDLSTLVVRLVRELRKASPDNPLPVKALDYLYRKDLSPSVLRGGKFGEFAATESVAQPVEQTRALTDAELSALIRKVEDKLGIVWFVPDDSETYAWRTTNTNERDKFARAFAKAIKEAK